MDIILLIFGWCIVVFVFFAVPAILRWEAVRRERQREKMYIEFRNRMVKEAAIKERYSFCDDTPVSYLLTIKDHYL